MEAVAWPSEAHSIPFSVYLFTCTCSLQCVTRVVRGLWLVLHPQYWLSLLYLGCAIVALCPGDPGAVDLQVQPLPMPQQFIDEVGAGAGDCVVLALGLGGS